MRTKNDLKDLPYQTWTNPERLREAVDESFPTAESARYDVIRKVLPRLQNRVAEERNALEDVATRNAQDPFVKSWTAELKSWDELIKRALDYSESKELFHKTGQRCTKCEHPLQGTETSICNKCRR